MSVAAADIYSPTVIHGTSARPPVASPAAPLRPASPATAGAVSIAPSVVLGWGGLPPSSGAPAPGYPSAGYVSPSYLPPGYPPVYLPPGYIAPGYPSQVLPTPLPPAPAPGSLHRWSTP